MITYIITEACFHTAYLINGLSDLIKESKGSFKLIIRQKQSLDKEQLTVIHEKLSQKKRLSEGDIKVLSAVYGDLSEAERALIGMMGVPKCHVFSLPADYVVSDLNSADMERVLRQESETVPLAAAIFLDCILKPWWLEVFQRRIVNAHSAVLPHARGMFAIEQTSAKGDIDAFTQAVGASIHYIDNGVDTGPLIAGVPLDDPWQYESIAEIKAASYLLAFQLLTRYIKKADAFQHHDVVAYKAPTGPVYRAKEYTAAIKHQAEEHYQSMRLSVTNTMVPSL
jgi:phosphoribosylglycinamide formyltransferase-1